MPHQLMLAFGDDGIAPGDREGTDAEQATPSSASDLETTTAALKPRLVALLREFKMPVPLQDVQQALGHTSGEMNPNPLSNPVNALIKQMRDAGELVVSESTFGSPTISLPPTAAHAAARPLDTGGVSSATSGLIRPDRQFTFDGLSVDEWPEPRFDADAITVDRPRDDIDGPEHRFVIRTEDRVEVLMDGNRGARAVEIGTVVEIDHLRRRVLVCLQCGDERNETWLPVERVFPTAEQTTPRRFTLRDDASAPKPTTTDVSSNETFAAEPSVVEQQPPYSLDDYRRYRERWTGGTVTAAELQAEFQRLYDGRDAFIADLKKRCDASQLKALATRFGCFDARRHNKQQNATHVWRSALQSFSLSGSVSYRPLGGQTFEEALAEQIASVTDDDIREFVATRTKQEADEQQAMDDPQNLEQFAIRIQRRGIEELSPEQRYRFESLHADKTRAERTAKTKTTVERIEAEAADNLDVTIKEGWHDREQIALWICQLSHRVDRSTFAELKIKAKQLGGWYSSFKKSDAGFQFRSRESAEKFQQLLAGDVDRTDELAARRTRKIENASERLVSVAETLETEAEDILDADGGKQKNTVRRAEMAAGMRGRAYANQAMAGTLRSIAAALSAGSAHYLDGVRARTHIETLTALLRRGKTNRNQAILKKQGNIGVWERHNECQRLDHRPVEDEDTLYVGYPYPSIYKRHLEEAIAVAENRKGVKQRARKMRSWLIGDGDFAEFTDEDDVRFLVEFIERCKAVVIETRWIESGMEDFKRLRAANIHTPQEMRCALRELIPHLHTKQEDDPVTKLEQQLIGTDIPDFYPTPHPIISRMLELADLQPGDCVLEPSAGKGDILDLIRDRHPEVDITAVEINATLHDILAAKGHNVERGDFLEHVGRYDKVVMNPPFSNGADIAHVRHAVNQLLPGGRVVAVMSEGPFFRQDAKATAFREWFDEHGGISEQLPDDAFRGTDAFRQTGVRTRIVSVFLPA